MYHSRKRLIQGLLLCSPLALLPLQAAPQAHSIVDSLPVAGGPRISDPVKNSLLIPPMSCSKQGRPPKSQPIGMAVSQLATQWLNQWGQAEIVLADRLSGSDLGSGHLALLLPLCEQSPQLLLTQWGLRLDHQQTTLNVGLGQRWFNQAQGYWGYHLFYDYRRQGYHGRLGLGLEQRSATRTVAVNGYLPVSGWRIAEDQATQSRPAKGIDLRLQQQLPQHPQLQLSAVLEHYFAQTLATAKTQPPLRPTAFTLGLEYTPLPLLTASYGYQLASGGARHHQLQLNLTYRLGMPLAPQLDPKQVAQSQTLASSRYAFIRRNSQIVLEQRAYEPPAKVVKADHAQAPQDTLQIALPNEQQQGEPGQSLTVPIKLSSSCALTTWQFTGEGDLITQGGALQQVDVDPEKQQAILTLPELPGVYSLEIVASKAQGITTRSNTLQVRVQAAEAEQVPLQAEAQNEPPAAAPPSRTRRGTAHKQGPDTGQSRRDAAALKPRRPAANQTRQNQAHLASTQVTTASEEQADFENEERVDQELPPGEFPDENNDQSVRYSLLAQPTALLSTPSLLDKITFTSSPEKVGESAKTPPDSPENDRLIPSLEVRQPLASINLDSNASDSEFDSPIDNDNDNESNDGSSKDPTIIPVILSNPDAAATFRDLGEWRNNNCIPTTQKPRRASCFSTNTEGTKIRGGTIYLNDDSMDEIAAHHNAGPGFMKIVQQFRQDNKRIGSEEQMKNCGKKTSSIVSKFFSEHKVYFERPENNEKSATEPQTATPLDDSSTNQENKPLQVYPIDNGTPTSNENLLDRYIHHNNPHDVSRTDLRGNPEETAKRTSLVSALLD